MLCELFSVIAVLLPPSAHEQRPEMWRIRTACWRDAGAAGTQAAVWYRGWVGSRRLELCQLFLPLPTVELLVHAHTRFRGWRREPVWLSDSTRSLLLVACMDLLSLFPVTSAIKCSQENPSPSQSKVCSQTFWGGEGLAEDLLPLILK